LGTASHETSATASKDPQGSFDIADNPLARHLLDVVASIIAEEYVQTVKRNPEMFREIASGSAAPRNDEVKL